MTASVSNIGTSAEMVMRTRNLAHDVSNDKPNDKPNDKGDLAEIANAHLLAPGAARGYLDFVRQLIEEMGYRLVRLRFMGGDDAVLQLMAERGDGSMRIEDCAEIARALEGLSAEVGLEVSSPGSTRPLTRPRDFETYAGYEAKLEVIVSIDGRKRFRGLIEGFTDGEVRLSVVLDEGAAPQILGFRLSDIAEMRLIENVSILKAALKKSKQR